MLSSAREILAGTRKDLAAAWRALAITDLAYKAITFAILTPATALYLQWLLSRAGSRVLADADIARFFLTTRAGIVALLLSASVAIAVSVLEAAALMAIGVSSARGGKLLAREALTFAARRAAAAFRLAGQIIIRAVAIVIPFALAIGLVYLTLLHGHDINYYLARKPPSFLVAAVLVGIIGAAFAVVAAIAIARWTLALPLLLFENVHPRHVLRESARRSEGKRELIVLVLAIWGVLAAAIAFLASWLTDEIARVAAPHLAGSAALLVVFLAMMAVLWCVLTLAAAIVNASLLSLVIVRLWLHAGNPGEIELPAASDGRIPQLSRRMKLAFAGTAALLAVGFALVLFNVTRKSEPVLVIAHRGASIVAPENTLAAFRAAVDQKTDFVEFDVQESSDGVVLVVHDSDLMKIGGSPMKIWEHTAAELTSVDIGSHKGPEFSRERVATLAETLASLKGRARVVVELKSYGHNQNLEQKVVDLVEAAGMANDCIFMSLDHGMVRKMKALRPSWRVGLLAAKAVGDPTSFGADFLAVEARMATARFVRRAHRANQDVYVWTVDDPAWMIAGLSRGVDGLITNKPSLAREVIARRARMSDAQRFLVAMLIRAGARTDALESEAALRP